MKIKTYIIVIFTGLVVILTGCTSNPVEEVILAEKGTIEQGDIMLFPKSEFGYIGDPMPFYDNGTMQMFYLLDERGGTIGFHPFALLQTEDFLNWTDIGTVIPYVNSISSQDLALGTGSVILGNDGLYHAYYTGHNGSGEMPYYEKIQHATSTDLINWTKLPDDGFFGGTNDFRDPYIYYNEDDNEYWMLITTRDYSGGVIQIYKSTDLYNWTDNGVFYRNTDGSYNMECPTLIEYNGYYYLSFSEQGIGNDRVVHYRYTTDIENGFITPINDIFDGWGFYAGRIEQVADRLLLSGWVPTKSLDKDYGTYEWAGNLVTHELTQDENGLLHTTILSEIDDFLSTEVAYPMTEHNTTITDSSYQMSSLRGYNYLLFESLLEKPTKMTAEINIEEASNVGITWNAYNSTIGTLNAYFDIDGNRLEFYTVETNLISQSAPEISIPFDYDGLSTLDITVITENDVLIVYVNETLALTSRAYDMADADFGFFTLGSNASISNIHFYE